MGYHNNLRHSNWQLITSKGLSSLTSIGWRSRVSYGQFVTPWGYISRRLYDYCGESATYRYRIAISNVLQGNPSILRNESLVPKFLPSILWFPLIYFTLCMCAESEPLASCLCKLTILHWWLPEPLDCQASSGYKLPITTRSGEHLRRSFIV